MTFKQLLLQNQDRIYNLCRHMLGNPHDAEDAAQDVFIKAYRNLENFTPEASLYTWLYRIAVNTCLDYKKKPFFESLFRTTPEGEEYAIEDTTQTTPERVYEIKQTGHALQKCLELLSPKLKAVIILKEIEGLSYEEIADILCTSMGTVKSRISRAREELRSSMKEFMEQK